MTISSDSAGVPVSVDNLRIGGDAGSPNASNAPGPTGGPKVPPAGIGTKSGPPPTSQITPQPAPAPGLKTQLPSPIQQKQLSPEDKITLDFWTRMIGQIPKSSPMYQIGIQQLARLGGVNTTTPGNITELKEGGVIIDDRDAMTAALAETRPTSGWSKF